MPVDFVATLDRRVLSADEEKDLARRRDEGDASARERLILANVRLAVRLTGRIARMRRRDPEDYHSAGFAGLCVAADKFDPARGRRFSTLAGWWIRSHVTRAIAEEGSTVRVPTYQVVAAGAVAAGRPLPGDMRREAVDAMPAARAAMASRATGWAHDDDRPGLDEAWPSATARWDADRHGPLWRLRDALAALDGPDADLVAARWGFGGAGPTTRSALARRMGCPEWVLQEEERRILAGLRRAVGEGEGESA